MGAGAQGSLMKIKMIPIRMRKVIVEIDDPTTVQIK